MTEFQSKRPRRVWLTVWLIVGVVAVIAAGTLWMVYAPPDTARYNAVIAAVANNRLSSDDTGRVALGGAFAGLTPHDELFVTRQPDGSFVALVPTFYPKGPAIDGLLYTSRPFGPNDHFEHGKGTNVDQLYTKAGAWGHLRLDKRLDDHWYKVSQGVE